MKEIFSNIFPFEPTQDQDAAIDTLIDFTESTFSKELFLLKGYAGTGKTTLISSYIQYLNYLERDFFLMAPTGRAAKVLSSYSNETAYTIHKSIYHQKMVDGKLTFVLHQNKLSNAVFIVDESSMIGNSGALGGSFNSLERTLLDDLFSFVYAGKNCKLILIGDDAQLPPVNSVLSPALDVDYLTTRYHVHLNFNELTTVTRQSLESGILNNATGLRRRIADDDISFPMFDLASFSDVQEPVGSEIEETLSTLYSQEGVEASMVVCRSNKQANSFNQYIRYNVLYLEDEISASDLMMVVKNNYYWMGQSGKEGFVANGDIIEVLRVSSFEEKFGLRFVSATIRFTGVKTEEGNELEVKLLMDSIYSESSALERDKSKQFFLDVAASYEHIRDRKERREAIKKDEYFNALQVKFAYAITCHKSQGGQWKNVFVDQGYLTEEMIDKEYLRWLYTAVTRAQNNLFLLNFHPRFFPDEG